MFWKLLFFMFLIKNNGLINAEHCKKIIGNLAATQGKFVQCSTDNSVPLSLCVACEGEYDRMLDSFTNLKKTNCSEKYFDKDPINVVKTMQSMLTGIWSKSFCDDCSKNYTINSTNYGTFNQLSKYFIDCLNNTNVNNTNLCVTCLGNYEDLNNFYLNLTNHNGGKACYDIQVAMNMTRLKWSQEMKCCRREFNMLLFMIASAFFTILPTIFYAGTFLYGKRRERNHGLLNSEPEFNIPTTSINTNATVSPNSQNAVERESVKKVQSFDTDSNDDSDDDDDEDDDDNYNSRINILK